MTPLRKGQSEAARSLGAGTVRKWRIAVVILALAGAGLVLLSTATYGAGLNRDSVEYFDAARSLASGQGIASHTGEPMVWWPPLYPMLLALVGFATGLDPSAFAHVVNALLFALVIALSARLVQAGLGQPAAYDFLSLCAVLFSVPLAYVYGWAVSECLFIPLVLLFLLSAQSYRDSGGTGPLVVMILSTALATLTRYIGVSLVPAGVMAVLLASKVNVMSRLRRALGFVILSLVPLALWVVRNQVLTRTPFGARFTLGYSLAENARRSVTTVFSWYFPGFGRSAQLVVLVGVGLGLLALVPFRAVRQRVIGSLKTVSSDCQAAVTFSVSFVILLLIAAMRDAWIDTRMLAPLYVPATLVLLKLVSCLVGSARHPVNAHRGWIPAALLALWLLLPLRSVAVSTAASVRTGRGLRDKSWRESATVAHTRLLASASDRQPPVYSNNPWALWELARVDAALSPRKTMGFRSRTAAEKIGDLPGRWPVEGEAYLVWFVGEGGRDFLFSPEELSEIADVREVSRLPDGTVYRASVRKPPGQDSTCQSGGTSPPVGPRP